MDTISRLDHEIQQSRQMTTRLRHFLTGPPKPFRRPEEAPIPHETFFE